MSLVDQALGHIRYPPERLQQSVLIAALAGNGQLNWWNATKVEPYLLWLRSISLDRNAGIRTTIRGEITDRNYEDILFFGNAIPVIDDEIPLNIPFDHTAIVTLLNTTAIAINNYQLRCIYEVAPYTITDKIIQGQLLDDEEVALAQKYELDRKIASGYLPMPYPEGPLLYQTTGNYSGNPAANQENTIVERSVPRGCKGILRHVWANRPAANFGSLVIRVYRERNHWVEMDIYPYCLPNFATATRYERPLDLWIPALTQISAVLLSTTGHAGITAQATIEIRRLTIWDKLSWNQRLSSDEEAMVEQLELREKLRCGLYELLTPVFSWRG